MKLICQLLCDSGQNMTKIKILDAYSIGLIAKKREPYVKDSVNFLVVVKENGIRKGLV
jgi:hypothetical protein